MLVLPGTRAVTLFSNRRAVRGRPPLQRPLAHEHLRARLRSTLETRGGKVLCAVRAQGNASEGHESPPLADGDCVPAGARSTGHPKRGGVGGRGGLGTRTLFIGPRAHFDRRSRDGESASTNTPSESERASTPSESTGTSAPRERGDERGPAEREHEHDHDHAEREHASTSTPSESGRTERERAPSARDASRSEPGTPSGSARGRKAWMKGRSFVRELYSALAHGPSG